DAQEAVFAPAVGARARVVVREVFPRRAVGRVILAYRAPLARGEVWSPAMPRHLVLAPVVQAGALGIGLEHSPPGVRLTVPCAPATGHRGETRASAPGRQSAPRS